MSKEMSSKKILCKKHISAYDIFNKTCQGYARKRILKPAGFSFLAGFPHDWLQREIWQVRP